ncbi:MAG: peptidoglycan DD-metalloendopeptidase family protein [Thermodesulfobacteriota bacterium]|nr:peptidoglycan DD-metalloendopeptidase family protein [Thermodesulfobacteriota bacterium]
MKKRWVRIFFLLIVIVRIHTVYAQNGISDLVTELREKKTKFGKVEEKIKENEKIVKKIKHEEKEVKRELRVIEFEIGKTQEELHKLKRQIEKKNEEIKILERAINKEENHLSKLKTYVARRLTALYKYRDTHYLQIILASNSFLDFRKRNIFLSIILENDAHFINEYNKNIDSLNREKEKHSREKDELENLKAQHYLQEKAYARTLKRRKTVLSQLGEKKVASILRIDELEKNSKNLQTVIDKLEHKLKKKTEDNKKRAISTGFKSRKGDLLLPIVGKITAFYGKHKNDELQTYIFYNGIEISVRGRAKVRAVHRGNIVYAGELEGYGNVMIIDHGERYYSLYAFLDNMYKRVGKMANRGDIIASIGNIKNAGDTSLYFEIRHNGQPVDPLDWLTKEKLMGKR